MEIPNETAIYPHRQYTKFLRITQMMLCLICLGIAIFLWLTMFTLTSAVIILFATAFAFFVVTTVDVMASVNDRHYSIYVWIVMAFTAAFMFFLCFGCMIPQILAIPLMVALVNFVTGIVFLIDGIIILTRASKFTPPNRIRPIRDHERGVQSTQTDDELMEPMMMPNEVVGGKKTIAPLTSLPTKRSTSISVTSYGGTFPVGKNETPLPTPAELTSLQSKKSSKHLQTCKDECVGTPQLTFQTRAPRKNDASPQTKITRSSGQNTIDGSFIYDLEEDDISVQNVQDLRMIGRGTQVYAPKCIDCCRRFVEIQEEDSSPDRKSTNSVKLQKKTGNPREIPTCCCHERSDKIAETYSNLSPLETEHPNSPCNTRNGQDFRQIYTENKREDEDSPLIFKEGTITISTTSIEEERIPPRRVTKFWDVFARRKKKDNENFQPETETIEFSYATTTQVKPEDFPDRNPVVRSSVDESQPRRKSDNISMEMDFMEKEDEKFLMRKPRPAFVSQTSIAESVQLFRDARKISSHASGRSDVARTPTDSALDEVRAAIRDSGIGAAQRPSLRVSYDTSGDAYQTSDTSVTAKTLKSWILSNDGSDVEKKSITETKDYNGANSKQYVPTVREQGKKTSSTTTPRRPSFITYNEPVNPDKEVKEIKETSIRGQKLETIKETREPKTKNIPEIKKKISRSATGTKAPEERKRRKSADSVGVPRSRYSETRAFLVRPVSPPNKCVCKCICTNNSQPMQRYQIYPLEQQPYHPKDNFRLPFKSFQLNDNNASTKKNDEKLQKCILECPACRNVTSIEEKKENRSGYPLTLDSEDERVVEEESETFSKLDVRVDPGIIAKIRNIEALDTSPGPLPRFRRSFEKQSEDDINIQKYPIFFKNIDNTNDKHKNKTCQKNHKETTEQSSDELHEIRKQISVSPAESEPGTGKRSIGSSGVPEIETAIERRSLQSPTSPDLEHGSGKLSISSPGRSVASTSSPEFEPGSGRASSLSPGNSINSNAFKSKTVSTRRYTESASVAATETEKTGEVIETDSLECVPECGRTGTKEPHSKNEQGTETEPGASFTCLPHCPYYSRKLEKGTETEDEGSGSFSCLPQCPFYLEHPVNASERAKKIFDYSPPSPGKIRQKTSRKEAESTSSARIGVKRLHSGKKK